jgi:TatA/E family protein of Tat protein translocase
LSLLFFDFGSGEILLIVLAVFIIFGPSKIPEMARNLGKFINEIKRASEDIKTEINREADRLDREQRLAEYKKKLEAEKKSTDTTKEPGTTETKEPEKKVEEPEKKVTDPDIKTQ